MAEAFPIELYRPIIATCDTPALLSLLRTSRTLSAEAERVLYHTVAFDDAKGNHREFLFLDRVSSCARVAQLITRLCITHSNPSSTEAEFARYMDRLGPVLRAAVNLQALQLEIADDFTVFAILCKCTFQLKAFESGYIEDSAGFMLFLAQQPRLEHLDITISSLPNAPAVCPNLSVLAVNHDLALPFLPGRRIRRIRLSTESTQDFSDDVQDYAEPLGHILSLAGLRFSYARDREILKYACNLQYLELLGSELQPSDVQLFASLKHLRGLGLVWCRIHGTTRDRLFEMLFAAVSNLRFIELTGYDVDLFYDEDEDDVIIEYRRWDRGAQAPRVIDRLHGWLTDIP